MGARPRDLDDGSDHPRGEGHAGQGPGDVRQGDAPAAGRPDRSRPSPRCASIPRSSPRPRTRCAGSTVKVASVATGFPSGQTFRDIKVAETRAAVDAGADEVDMVIDRGAFLSGDYLTVFEEIVEVKEAAGEAHLKVILETGELETYDNVRRASVLAMAAGADFIKTSTGKVTPAATLPVTLVMLEAIRDFERSTGRQVGMKPAGGIRTAKEAIQYLVVLYETLGPRWMSPDWFRFGASVAAQRRADADRVPAHRPLPGPGRLHARLSGRAWRPSGQRPGEEAVHPARRSRTCRRRPASRRARRGQTRHTSGARWEIPSRSPDRRTPGSAPAGPRRRPCRG